MSSTPYENEPTQDVALADVEVEETQHRGELPRAALLIEQTGPASSSSWVLERLSHTKPTPRRAGARAEVAGLRAQLRVARSRGDLDLERAAATKLARRLAGAGSELDHATKLARRSLLLGDEPRLREELSGWFASLGRLALAAGTLEPLLDRSLAPKERNRLWVRIAVLRARAGDGTGAAGALVRAAEADRTDPLPVELLGALRAWAPEVMTALRAARSLVEASQRRDARGDERGALESVLQAFLVLPAHRPAAERLARYLAQSGRFQAADEVWRRCAAELPVGTERADIHARRLRDALGAGAPAIALGAALDAGADAVLDPDSLATASALVNEGVGASPIPNFDGLLFSLGLSELLAARLSVAALTQEPATRTRTLLALARMLAGPMASPERAAHVLLDLLEQDPGCNAAFVALSEYSVQSGDHNPLFEALVRIGLGHPQRDTVALRLTQLAQLAAESLRDPAPGLWALARLSLHAELPDELRALVPGLVARAEKSQPWSAPADWRRLSMADMRRALDHLAFRPEQAASYAEALAEMHRRDPQSTRWPRMLERVLVRLGRGAELAQMWDSAAVDPSLRCLGLLRGYLRAGEPSRGLALLREVEESGKAAAQPFASPPPAELGALLATIAARYGNPEQRARGIALFAQQAKTGVKAILLSVASEQMLRLGQREVAAQLSEAACREDAQAARAFTTHAETMHDSRALVAGLAFERATQLVLPRLEWCRALSEVSSGSEQRAVRLRWLKRWASLSPLDPEAARALVEELSKGEDAGELEAALDWLISQPRPRAHLSDAVTRATLRLVEMAPPRGRAFARRLLGVLGVGDASVVAALSELAARVGDSTLRLALIERLLAEGNESERAELLFEASLLRAESGDNDLAIDCLYRALQVGADVSQVEAAFQRLGAPNSSEGELRQLELRVEIAERTPETEPVAKGELLRELGAAYWDLAGDRLQAIDAFVRGANCYPSDGNAVLARDLVSFLGYDDAVTELSTLVQSKSKEQAASLVFAFASVALADGALSLAGKLATRVLELSPERAEALAVLERVLTDDQVEELERAYARVDDAVLGCYATRALHYRAARQLERRKEYSRALDHSVRAFEAVPSEGIAFGLMLRLAALSGRDREMGRVLTRVAEDAHDPEQRELWLGRATRAMGTDVEGQTLRVEVLLRALALRGEAAAVDGVGKALSGLMLLAPERTQQLAEQYATSARTLLRGLDVDGAGAVTLAVARVASECFSDASLVADALTRGWQLEPGSAAFARCADFLPLLQSEPTAALQVVEAARSVGSDGSVVFLGFALKLAEVHAPQLVPELLVAQAVRSPDDSAILARARLLASSDSHLAERLNQIVPPAQFAKAMFARVSELSGTPAAQAELLQALLDSSSIEDADYQRGFDLLKTALAEAVDTPALEALLGRSLDSAHLTKEQRISAARELAQLLHQRKAHAAALDIFAALALWQPLIQQDIEAAASIARAGGDTDRELRYVTELELIPSLGQEQRLHVLRRLGELHVAVGNRSAARVCFEQLLLMQPNDSAAFEYMIDDAERTENYPRLCELLSQRLGRQRGEPEVAHRLFTIYKERLANPEAARQTLERALALRGEDVELLEPLGAHLVELGSHAVAAKIYQRAGRIAREPRRAAHFAACACRCFLDAGDNAAAREVLSVKGLYPNTEMLSQLRVELTRKTGQTAELAEALEELAFVSMAAPEERARILSEAATLTLELGEFELALTRAQRAARVAPLEVAVQLFAKFLEYKQRGAGTKPDAQRTIGELRVLGPTTQPELGELKAFLLAEALDRRAPAGNPGQRELLEAEATFGRRPLIALGLAERYEAQNSFTEASACYMTALEGDLRGVRARSSVILQAARSSSKAGQLPRARGLLGMITPEDPRFSEAELLEQSLARLEADYIKTQARLERGPRSGVATQGWRPSRAPDPAVRVSPSLPVESRAESSDPAIVGVTGSSAPPTAVSGDLQAPSQPQQVAAAERAPVPATEPPIEAVAVGSGVAAARASVEPAAGEPDVSPGEVRTTLRAASRAGAGESTTAAAIESEVQPHAADKLAADKAATDKVATEPLATDRLSTELPVRASDEVIVPAALDAGVLLPPPSEAPSGTTKLTGTPLNASMSSLVGVSALRTAVERPPARTRIGLGQPVVAIPPAVESSLTATPAARPRPLTRPPAPPIDSAEVLVSPFEAAASALEFVAHRDAAPAPLPAPEGVTTDATAPVGAVVSEPEVAERAEPLVDVSAGSPPQAAPEDPSLEVGVVLLADVADELRAQVFADQEERASSGGRSRSSPPASPTQARLERAVLQAAAPHSQSERSLLDGLRAGSLEDGQRLLRLLDGQADRARDLVNVCRLLVSLAPGDGALLEALYNAVLRDNDIVYANALRHARTVFDNPKAAPVAPPLHRQLEQTDALLSLITGPSEPALEALGLVWQHAPQLFRTLRKERTLGRRIRIDDATSIAALTLTVSRLLGCSRISLFESQGEGARFEIGLEQPMAVVVGRPVMAESPVFRFHFGRIMLAARPEFAVVMGLPGDELRVVLSAVLAAFGPPRRLSGDVSRVAQFAERLWELLPARAQRRIGELCEDPSLFEYDVVTRVTQRALSRAGLYVCGDLGVAVREVATAEGVTLDWSSAGVLRTACERSEAIADLVRLATGVEYSDARWRGGRSSSSAGRALG